MGWVVGWGRDDRFLGVFFVCLVFDWSFVGMVWLFSCCFRVGLIVFVGDVGWMFWFLVILLLFVNILCRLCCWVGVGWVWCLLGGCFWGFWWWWIVVVMLVFGCVGWCCVWFGCCCCWSVCVVRWYGVWCWGMLVWRFRFGLVWCCCSLGICVVLVVWGCLVCCGVLCSWGCSRLFVGCWLVVGWLVNCCLGGWCGCLGCSFFFWSWWGGCLFVGWFLGVGVGLWSWWWLVIVRGCWSLLGWWCVICCIGCFCVGW